MRKFYYTTKGGQTYSLKNRNQVLKEWILKNDIPKEKYKTTQRFFDSRAWNNDDREYTAEVERERYSTSKIKEIKDYISEKYNISNELIEITNS